MIHENPTKWHNIIFQVDVLLIYKGSLIRSNSGNLQSFMLFVSHEHTNNIVNEDVAQPRQKTNSKAKLFGRTAIQIKRFIVTVNDDSRVDIPLI